MRIRRISYASFRRNTPFWLGRQTSSDEIHLMRLGKVIGIFYGEQFPEELKAESRPSRRKVMLRAYPPSSQV